MANCPNCGSEHIQLKQDTNVDWGRAVAGWALFGVVGGAVGAVTGEERSTNVCLDCGTSWKATDLYKIRQVIKNLTDVTLDLANESDRNFINDFIHEVSPYIESISDAEKKAELHIKISKDKLEENASMGTGLGCLIGIVGCTIVASTAAADVSIWVLLIPAFIGWIIGSILDQTTRESVEKNIEKEIEKAKIMKLEAEENLKHKITDFMTRHSL